jgi:hypothetical protein
VKREVGYGTAKGDGMGIEKRVAIWAEAEHVHLDMYNIINNMLKLVGNSVPHFVLTDMLSFGYSLISTTSCCLIACFVSPNAVLVLAN